MRKNVFLIFSVCIIACLFAGCTANASNEVETSPVVEATETIEIFKFPIVRPAIIETNPVEEEIVPRVPEVPKYNQIDYTCPYGEGIELASTGEDATVRNSGCGVTCLSMVATYMLDDPTLTPDVLAAQLGRYNTPGGSIWALFTEGAESIGLTDVRLVMDWTAGGVEEALRNGCLVVSNQRGGVFTSRGHYILLAGITDDGKVIVHDPNGNNWTEPTLIDGFKNGFNYTDISYTSVGYWIYGPREI